MYGIESHIESIRERWKGGYEKRNIKIMDNWLKDGFFQIQRDLYQFRPQTQRTNRWKYWHCVHCWGQRESLHPVVCIRFFCFFLFLLSFFFLSLSLFLSQSPSLSFFLLFISPRAQSRHSVLPLENSNLCLSFSLSVGQSVYLSVCYGIHTLSLNTCRTTFTVSAVLNDIRTFPSKFKNTFHGDSCYFFLYKIYRKWNTFA